MTPALQLFKQWLSISISVSTALLLFVWIPSLASTNHSSLSSDRPPYTGNRAGGSRMWEGGSSNPNSVSAYFTEVSFDFVG